MADAVPPTGANRGAPGGRGVAAEVVEAASDVISILTDLGRRVGRGFGRPGRGARTSIGVDRGRREPQSRQLGLDLVAQLHLVRRTAEALAQPVLGLPPDPLPRAPATLAFGGAAAAALDG